MNVSCHAGGFDIHRLCRVFVVMGNERCARRWSAARLTLINHCALSTR